MAVRGSLFGQHGARGPVSWLAEFPASSPGSFGFLDLSGFFLLFSLSPSPKTAYYPSNGSILSAIDGSLPS